VPVENLLGGEEYYEEKAKEEFKTAMKTFDATRPIVASMAVGIARASYE
jgi:acyl-CoA dehydrogenase